jgi:hypothetical protein
MATTRWDEVGSRFTALGRTLQDRWTDGRGSADVEDEAGEVRHAMDGVKASLDDLADTITRTVNDPDVHEAATAAASGLIEALSSSLDDLADRIKPKPPAE